MSPVRSEGFRRVEQEIAAEKATALGRAGERLEAALTDLQALADALTAAPADPSERASVLAQCEQALARAREARVALLIQREALGLRRHAIVDERFPEPARRWPAGPPRA